MTEVNCDSLAGKPNVGGATGVQVMSLQPSIVVDPGEEEEVESGELRWPPDDLCYYDDPSHAQTQDKGPEVCLGAEPPEKAGGVSN